MASARMPAEDFILYERGRPKWGRRSALFIRLGARCLSDSCCELKVFI